MDFDWERFIDVAEHLRNYSNREEYQRTAVGRYYYACYLKAREIYNKKRNKSSGAKISHSKLIDIYQESENKYAQIIGNHLEALFNNRKHADYDEEFKMDYVEENEKTSKEVFELFEKLK